VAQVKIREIQPSDAGAYLALCLRLDAESTLMMYEPGERASSEEVMRRSIDRMEASGNQTVLLAEVDGAIAGYVGVYGGEFRRDRHCGYLVTGVLQAYARQGIGTQLFAAAEVWAKAHRLLRLELTVQQRNQAAVKLYQKMGFLIEGERTASMMIDGQLIDEYYMGKVLS